MSAVWAVGQLVEGSDWSICPVLASHWSVWAVGQLVGESSEKRDDYVISQQREQKSQEF